MKAMTREELAQRAGVTVKTLRESWMKRDWELLTEMGMRPREILPPNVVEFLAGKWSIDVDD